MSALRNRAGELRWYWSLLVVAAFVVSVGWSTAWAFGTLVEKSICMRKADGLGLHGDWGFWTGCRVEVDGRLVPIEYLRVTDEGVVLQ